MYKYSAYENGPLVCPLPLPIPIQRLHQLRVCEHGGVLEKVFSIYLHELLQIGEDYSYNIPD